MQREDQEETQGLEAFPVRRRIVRKNGRVISVIKKFLKDDRGEASDALLGCVIAFVVIGFIGFLIVASLWSTIAGVLGWGVNTAANSAKGVVEKTADPDHILASYHTFRDKRNEYNSALENFKSTKDSFNSYVEGLGARKDWTFEDKTEYARQRETVVGQFQYVNQVAAGYNADSEKADFSIFKNLPEWAQKDGPLPTKLDLLTQKDMEGLR